MYGLRAWTNSQETHDIQSIYKVLKYLVTHQFKLAELSVARGVSQSRARTLSYARFVCLLRIVLSVLATPNQWQGNGEWHAGTEKYAT